MPSAVNIQEYVGGRFPVAEQGMVMFEPLKMSLVIAVLVNTGEAVQCGREMF